jgi:putative aldouronate transport system permease protein
MNIAASVVPVVFAILFSEMRGKYAKKVIQTVTTLPNFISWVVVYGLFFALFSVDGALNNILMNLGLITEPTNILGNNDLAWFFQLAAGVWKGTGFGAIVYLAAIAGIDLELYDAANIDGAGRFAKIWYITVPGLMPTFMTLLILSIGNLLSSNFEYFYVFNNPIVEDKLMVLSLYTYKVGMQMNNYSYSTAVGMTTSLVSVIILFTTNGLSKAIRGNSIF